MAVLRWRPRLDGRWTRDYCLRIDSLDRCLGGERVRIALGIALAGLALLLAWSAAAVSGARSWEDTLAPLAVGRAVREHEITALSRGEENDVVLPLRGRAEDGGAIEVHVLDRGRWSGIRETRSFGVAYETPRSSASVPECEAVSVLAQAGSGKLFLCLGEGGR